jgi:magnesium-transporting ATPase (P-type)
VIPTATVLRDGTWIETPVRNVVPGDVFRLPADDLVPADARLLESRDLSVQQSMLTGESLPADKIATADGEEAFGPDAPHWSSSAPQSSAAALRDTQIGRAIALVHREPGHN